MGKFQFFFLLGLLVALPSLYSVVIDYLKLKQVWKPFDYFKLAQPESIDYFMLAQQWPPSLNSSTTYQTFTIHGLWPDAKEANRTPENCNGPIFVKITNKILLHRLNKDWPDVLRRHNQKFWEKEWDKHGTCSPYLYKNNQMKYFNLAVKLKNRYDLLQHLKNNDFQPGPDPYPLEKITSCIKNLTSHFPVIQCDKDKRWILREVRICFDTGGSRAKVIDCPPNRRCLSLCDQEISFPAPSG